MEIWKDVEGYEGLYQVSNLGRIKSLRTNRILKNIKDKDGYEIIFFSIHQNQKCFKIHRLVAEAFIPNPDNKPQVDHINSISDDNRAENLRWATPHENSMNNNTTLRRSETLKLLKLKTIKALFMTLCQKQRENMKFQKIILKIILKY